MTKGVRAPKVAAAAAALAVATSLVAACVGVDPEAQALAENGSDIADVAARLSGLTASFALAAGGTSLDPTALAATSALYSPAGCLTTRVRPDSTTLAFADCAGPWGIAHIHGEVTVGPAEGKPQPGAIEVKATGLAIDGSTIDLSGEATLESTGPTDKTLTWTPAVSGTTARGRSFQSEGSWSATWLLGGTCIEVATSGDQAVVDGAPLVVEKVSGLKRCSEDCPTAGTMTVSNDKGLSDTVSFDGMGVVAFVTASGTNDIQLACGL